MDQPFSPPHLFHRLNNKGLLLGSTMVHRVEIVGHDAGWTGFVENENKRGFLSLGFSLRLLVNSEYLNYSHLENFCLSRCTINCISFFNREIVINVDNKLEEVNSCSLFDVSDCANCLFSGEILSRSCPFCIRIAKLELQN